MSITVPLVTRPAAPVALGPILSEHARRPADQVVDKLIEAGFDPRMSEGWQLPGGFA
ncbi:MAG: hypothetical protein WAV00_04040 [Nocardioides sp.]